MAQPFKQIGKYEILEEIGRGGFAVVYRARDTRLNRFIALKVLHPYRSAEADFVERFRREAEIAANLDHPNIVTVYEADEADGQLYLVMKYVRGRTLREMLLATGALPLEQALPLLAQIASALDYAHMQGVVHRDIKPSNIIVEDTNRGPRMTVLDFGLVKALKGSTQLTRAGTLLGSPEYMAPEQADPGRVNEIGPATDRYALGIIAYQMLTGRVPFPGETPATLNAHLNLKPPDPHTLRSEVSPQVSRVLQKMLAKVPADRYASAREFVQALQTTAKPLVPSVHTRRDDGEHPKSKKQEVQSPVLETSAVERSKPPAIGRSNESAVQLPFLGLAKMMSRADHLMWLADAKEMVRVPDSEFLYGVQIEKVKLTEFWIDKTPVTNAEFEHFVRNTNYKTTGEQKGSGYAWNGKEWEETKGANWRHPHGLKTSIQGIMNHPVVQISWKDAMAYAEWVDKRLPIEQEWEKAARGTDGRSYPWGNQRPTNTIMTQVPKQEVMRVPKQEWKGETGHSHKSNFPSILLGWFPQQEWEEITVTRVQDIEIELPDDKKLCNFGHGNNGTTSVGKYSPQGDSSYGCVDMAGNVWEWTASVHDQNTKILCGGSWTDSAVFITTVARLNKSLEFCSDFIGFRCVVSPGK